MKASLRALLYRSLDYAGLFPPAELPLEQALAQWQTHQQSPEAWMLARFVCPVARLNELPAGISVSAVGRGGDDAKSWLRRQLRDDGPAILAYHRRGQGQANIPAVYGYETRLCPELLQPEFEMELRVNARVLFQCLQHQNLTLKTFLELDLGPQWRTHVERLLSIPSLGTKLKIRCGGKAVPTVDDLAFALTACRKAEIRAKFTAGLHHPLRHGEGTHGFINLFVAGVLGHARQLDETQLASIIAAEDPSEFQFTDDGLAWRDFRASVPEIEKGREEAVVSFGSCSFDEPRDDLGKLGWLAN